MADTVSFKVFLTKEEEPDEARPEVRRFGIDQDVVSNFLYLSEKLQTVFSALRSSHFTISWKDTDGDKVIISSDEELKIALTETANEDIRKLYVTLHSKYPDNYPVDKETSSALHVGVVCDGCEKDIQGFRYKCIQCPDYDLCGDCEAKGLHPEHCMIRSAVPLQWRSHFGRRLAHCMNKFARKSTQYGGNDMDNVESPNKKGKFHHNERRGGGGHHEDDGHHGGGRHHGGGGHHGGGHCGGGPHRGHHGRPERPSWLDSLATYLNDWAYLPGEGGCPMRDQSSENESNADKGGSGGSGAENKRAPSQAEIFKNIGDNLASLLDPLGIDVDVIAEDAGRSANDSNNPKPQATQNNVPSTSTNKFPGEGKKLVETTPAASIPSSSATAVNASAPTADRPSTESEEWTLLNQQDSPMSVVPVPVGASVDGAIPKSSANPPAATLLTPTLASAPASQLIYPKLPQQSEPAVIYHRDPNIQRAVLAMMQMGFSNEGGWLTHLLVSQNGDISKTLDILQPVRPDARRL